ncbi:MAG: hypothetical protein KGQ36_07010 [Rickettsiales bacterium]|nr:hypothetical protein [Rickettsiales bacterium]
MPFETITLPILFFITLNFLILFFIKKEIDQILALIFSYIFIIAFFSLTISSYLILKEIILILTCYLIALLFIIHRSDSSITSDKKPSTKFVKFFVIPTSIFTIIAIFFMVIWTVKNTHEISNLIETKEITKKNEELFGNLNSNQISSKTLITNNREIYKEEEFFNTSGRKRAYLREKLSDNFLLKNSSELILLIISLPLITMLLTKKEQ